MSIHRAVLAWTLLAAPPAMAQADFTTWLNERLRSIASETERRTQVAVSVRSNSKQDEAPSMAANTSSLVDTSSASDLVGVALNIAGMQGSTEGSKSGTDATTATATVSAYALYSAVRGVDPLEQAHYCAPGGRLARRLSVTLGYDDGATSPSGGGPSTNPIIAGAKLLAYNGRDVCDADAFKGVTEALVPATALFGRIRRPLLARFYALSDTVDLPAAARTTVARALDQAAAEALANHDDVALARRIAFYNLLEDPDFFPTFLAALGDQADAALADQVRQQGIDPFIRLDQATSEAIEAFRMAPQVSFSFLTKQRADGGDDYQGQAILDVGVVHRLNFTANGAYDASRGAGGASNGGRVAAQLQFQPLPDALAGPRTLRLSLAFEGGWASAMQPTYKGQLKINLPIPRVLALSGFELPLSVTVANRSELIDETQVQGLVGFTLDTSQMLAALPGLL